jgi:hypothetical protein
VKGGLVLKKVFAITSILLIFFFAAFVQGGPGQSKKFAAKPYISDPEDTDAVVAAWVTRLGLPDAGKSKHALVLEKNTLSATDAAAGAKIRWLKDKLVTDLTELGFDYRNDGHCTANAPRFVVTIDAVEYTLGCTAGTATPAPDDVVNWTRVRFGAAEFSAAGFPATGTISDAQIVFDEGTDAGTGSIYLDNIDVNASLIGKPGKAKPPQL